ncbi:hypothetical protein SAMN04488564_102361 [Lentzea waywayandensis]|uniref:Uncharacterized protein n=1 Tax=Lentzea waywayandensis TaxID=84724 RepID=A0A1I6DDX1_9PSEU|nr:hypothetical protein [Lentzea waywayandensis]SFR03636.1 hypothetical protein SAMN04488564_102361 [Lentzea waywayandensis]
MRRYLTQAVLPAGTTARAPLSALMRFSSIRSWSGADSGNQNAEWGWHEREQLAQRSTGRHDRENTGQPSHTVRVGQLAQRLDPT